MLEVVGAALVVLVELEPEGAVVGDVVGVELEDEGVVDELDGARELPACSGVEQAPQTSANNPTATTMEVGPFVLVIEDRRPRFELPPGIVGEMSMISRLGGANNRQGTTIMGTSPAAPSGDSRSWVHESRLPRGQRAPAGPSGRVRHYRNWKLSRKCREPRSQRDRGSRLTELLCY
jgi:hypothetical protein